MQTILICDGEGTGTVLDHHRMNTISCVRQRCSPQRDGPKRESGETRRRFRSCPAAVIGNDRRQCTGLQAREAATCRPTILGDRPPVSPKTCRNRRAMQGAALGCRALAGGAGGIMRRRPARARHSPFHPRVLRFLLVGADGHDRRAIHPAAHAAASLAGVTSLFGRFRSESSTCRSLLRILDFHGSASIVN